MSRAATLPAGRETRERILAAALAAFAEQGFDGATTRDIAARADVTLGLLQYHFGGKPKLWRASVDRAFEELRSGLEGLLAQPRADARERLRQLIHAYAHFVARRPEFVRMMHDEGKRRGPRMRWLVDRHVEPIFSALVPIVERAQAEGVLLAGIAPVHFIYILVGSLGLIFHQAEECRRLSGLDPSKEANVAAHARAVEHLFLAHGGGDENESQDGSTR